MTPEQHLRGRTALITGGSRGIGEATARNVGACTILPAPMYKPTRVGDPVKLLVLNRITSSLSKAGKPNPATRASGISR